MPAGPLETMPICLIGLCWIWLL